MKNKIYLTEEGKKEIEDKILKLEKLRMSENLTGYGKGTVDKEYELLKEILSNSTILPVEKDITSYFYTAKNCPSWNPYIPNNSDFEICKNCGNTNYYH
jgi:hypothetical protein